MSISLKNLSSHLHYYFLLFVFLLFTSKVCAQSDTLHTDSSSEIVQVDSVLKAVPTIAKPDSINKAIATPIVDSATDTLPKHFFFGAGIGWSLGSSLLFETWERGLPDSLGDLGLHDTFLVNNPLDTVLLRYELKEAPDIYNLVIPITLSLNYIRDKDNFSFMSRFAYFKKSFTASVAELGDSTGDRIDLLQTLSSISLTISAGYSLTIPSNYFSVDNMDRVELDFFAGYSPWVSVSKKNSISQVGSSVLFNQAREAIGEATPGFSAWGQSISFRTGISVSKYLLSRDILKFGLHFSSYFNGVLTDESKTISRINLNPRESNNRTFTYRSNQIELNVQLLFSSIPGI